MIKQASDIPLKVIAKLQKVFSKYPEIRDVLVFGSRAMGNAKHGSDIDLCVVGENIDSGMLTQLNMILNEEENIPHFIDIVHYESISNVRLKEHIDRFGISLFHVDK